MIEHCKVCEAVIPAPQLGDDYWCIHCQRYHLVCMENGIAESETLTMGNYYLVFFPIHKEANIVERTDENRILKTFQLEELTHEVALHWVDKLKTYVIFQ